MNARDEILSNIRRSLKATGAEAPRRSAVNARMAMRPRGVIPARGQRERAARIALFVEMARAALASVAVVRGPDEVPAEVARFLRDANLPARLRMGVDPLIAGMDWEATQIEVSTGASDGHDLNGLAHAFAGVAETGTLFLASGPDNPTTLNFLPDNHIVVVRADDIEGDYESAFDRLRALHGDRLMPRALNMITGPSRSADIAQTMLLGAHGPRKLHVVVIDGAE